MESQNAEEKTSDLRHRMKLSGINILLIMQVIYIHGFRKFPIFSHSNTVARNMNNRYTNHNKTATLHVFQYIAAF